MPAPWPILTRIPKPLDFADQDSSLENVWKTVDRIHLDYIDLYRKFAPQPNQESYSLENISQVELEEGKLDYVKKKEKDGVEEDDGFYHLKVSQ